MKESFLSDGFKKGMKVQIPKWVSGMKHRKNRNGIVTQVNGAYIYVRPMWCKWVIELYPCELKRI